jgi:hypothetical protein
VPGPSTQFKQRRSTLWLVAILAILVGGVIIGMRVRLDKQNSTATVQTAGAIISEIQFGALFSAQDATKPNPRIEQKQFYATQDRLVMKVTTVPTVTDSFEVGVRLLTPSGSVVEMDPPSATFTPGTSSFCCWQINKEGTYTLQIFRPEKTVSTIPVTIRKGIEQVPGEGKYNYQNVHLF